MKKQFYILGALCLTFIFASCGGGEEATGEEEGTKEEKKCFYSLNTDTYDLNWTAYKTTAEVPVGGTFNDITMTADESDDLETALTSIAFEINTESVESNDEDRNKKIAEHFFGTINTPTITGNLKSVDMEGESATVSITMNGITFDVEGDFTMEEENFSFKSEIDVQNWNGVPGIQALNKVCADLHRGDDGVSVLWQHVNISFDGSLNKDCE